MLSVSQNAAVILSLAGSGFGLVSVVFSLFKMSSNKAKAYKGDLEACNHLVLPRYRRLFIFLALTYVFQFGLFAVLFCLMSVQGSRHSKGRIEIGVFFCASSFQFICNASPLLLWVKSLSRGGFKKVGKIVLPGLICSIIILVCLLVVEKSKKTQTSLLVFLLILGGAPSLGISIGVLSKKLSSRVELRSSSSRSTTEFLLVYSVCMIVFGSIYCVDKLSSSGIIGLGATVLLTGMYPVALYRTCAADTKFWRGLGKHNRGGIVGSSDDPARVDTVTLRVASTHLQTVMSDLSSLMIDFAFIEIGTIIGQGASSHVYKAEYKGDKVAIKVLNPPEITEEELVSIRDEIFINTMLSHPAIVGIIGICVRPPEIGIVMEYCHKGTLKKSLQTNALEWTAQRRLQAMFDLATAVAHVHASGYMHRDIKAENLFVTDKWKIKLGDFGESRSILKQNQTDAEKKRDSAQWDQRMTVLGTVAYMAPELVNAERKYTEAIDVYAMGITFWEIWTGNDPFDKENTFSLYQLVAQGARPDIPSTCPEGFEEVLRESWQTSADHRPPASTIAKKMTDVINCFKAALPETTEESFCSSTAEECTPLQQENISSTQQNMREGEKVEVSFQFDDMYNTSDPIEHEDSHTNPLKLLFLKSLKKKT